MPTPPSQSIDFSQISGKSICLVFDTEAELKLTGFSFLSSSLEQGRRAVYLVSETHDLSMLDFLRPAGGRARTAGRLEALVIQRASQVFEQTRLSGVQFANWLQDETRKARQDGYTGLNLTVEMGWAAAKHMPAELQAFETDLQNNLPDNDSMVLTMYNRDLFSSTQLMSVLIAHPKVVYAGQVRHNPFYIPMAPSTANLALQNWLNQLQSTCNPEGPAPESDQRLSMIIASMPVVIFALNRQGEFTLSEGKGLSALGLKPGEAVGQDAREVFPNVNEVDLMLQRALMGDTFSLDVNVNGNIFETHCSPLRDQADNIIGMLGVSVDITDRRLAEEALRASEERYRLLVENQGEGAGIFGVDGQVLYINLAAEGILGLPVDQIIGRNIGDFVPPDQKPIFAQQIASRKAGQASTYEVGFLRLDGQRRQVLVTATPRFDAEGNYLGSFSIFRDITERKRMEDRLRFQSNHDALTGLFNRYYFEEELNQMNRNRRYPAGVIVVDVDDLKVINDQHGHLSGDDLLRRVARLLRSSFRLEDSVARIGGDEFAIILPDCDQKVLDLSIERLRKNLEGINRQTDHLPVQISIGGATAEVGQSLQKAFDLADQRMYREKYARKKKV